jgi:hypothetical protein
MRFLLWPHVCTQAAHLCVSIAQVIQYTTVPPTKRSGQFRVELERHKKNEIGKDGIKVGHEQSLARPARNLSDFKHRADETGHLRRSTARLYTRPN